MRRARDYWQVEDDLIKALRRDPAFISHVRRVVASEEFRVLATSPVYRVAPETGASGHAKQAKQVLRALGGSLPEVEAESGIQDPVLGMDGRGEAGPYRNENRHVHMQKKGKKHPRSYRIGTAMGGFVYYEDLVLN